MGRQKIFKIVGILLLSVILILAITPILFKDKLIQTIKNSVHKNINATLDFDNVSLSFLSNFPKASVSIYDLSLITSSPFEGDTLFYAEKIKLKMSLGQLFRKEGEPLRIKSFAVNNAISNILVNKEGKANYAIGLAGPSDTKAINETNEKNIIFSIDNYQISDSRLLYHDAGSNVKVLINELNHSGSGDLSAKQSELSTSTSALVSFEKDSTEYFNKNMLHLDALIRLDLEENKYSFLENKALINELPLVFDGFVKIFEDKQEVDITFQTPSSDFKNFLAMIPATYARNIEDVQTSGNFEVLGFFKGIVDASHIPTFSIAIHSENASFQYPDLPKGVSNISISSKVANKTGILQDTYVQIDTLSFQIDTDVFNASAKIQHLLTNPYFNTAIKGRLNLANLSKVYPVTFKTEVSGILDAQINAAFDLESIQNKRYKNIHNNGSIAISKFHFFPDHMVHPLTISKAAMSFDTQTVSLHELTAKTGQSDFTAKGSLHNLLGFMLDDQKLKGDFDLRAGTLAVKDFMITDEKTALGISHDETTQQKPQKLSIPAFLDATIHASANKVLYKHLTLQNVKGTLRIEDQKATITKLTSQLFDGQLALSGELSTKEVTPVFDMQFQADAFDIAATFKDLQLFQYLAPLANSIKGKMDADISFSGNLEEDLSPNFSTLSGTLFGELLNASFDQGSNQLLQSFEKNISFIQMKDLILKNQKVALTFQDGKVNLKPMQLKYQDIDMLVSGSHNLDKSLSYNVKLDVPVKYLGKDLSNLMAKLSDEEATKIKVPVHVSMGGTLNSPTIKTDLNSAVSALSQQLTRKQKDKLVKKGSEILKDLLDKNTSDTTGTPKKEAIIKETTESILGNLFGKKKKDSTNN